MSRPDGGAPWFVRLARLGAATLTILAILVWITPVNVRSQSGFFGCGSPSDPRGGGDLVDLVCKTDLDEARTLALVLLLAGGAVLFLSEFVAPRVKDRLWASGVIAAAPLGLALMSVGVGFLFTVIGETTKSGLPFRCGTAMVPATDPISTLACGHLAGARLVLCIGAIVLGVGVLAGGAYLAVGHSAGSRTGTAQAGGGTDPSAVEPAGSQGEPGPPLAPGREDGAHPGNEQGGRGVDE